MSEMKIEAMLSGLGLPKKKKKKKSKIWDIEKVLGKECNVKMPPAKKIVKNIPKLDFELNVIYRLENTTTRNAFWEIYAVVEDDEHDTSLILESRFGKIGNKPGKITEEGFEYNVGDLKAVFVERIKAKYSHGYVYVGQYDYNDTWKGISQYNDGVGKVGRPKQKAVPQSKEIDTNEFTKQMFKRVIKFTQSESADE